MFYDWKIIGHEKELKLLEEHLRSESVGHAYLFTGMKGAGKYTIAKTFAQILQCPQYFCRTCAVCIQVEKGCHLDTIEMSDDGSSIKIEPVREIIQRLNMTPQSRYKILLMENIGRLTEEAGNSLLKLIEEPTEKTVFLFTAESAREVLPTILSRVYHVKFTATSETELRAFLEKQYPSISKNILDQVIMLSSGSPGRAVRLMDNREKLQSANDLYEKTRRFLEEKTMTDRFGTIQELIKEPEIIKEFLGMLITLLRHRTLNAQNHAEQKKMMRFLEEIPRASELIRKNVNPRLVLENLSINFSS